jgi:acyl dehydratase
MTEVRRYFEDVQEGEELPPLEKQPDIVDVVKWSGATWTFVPIFYDADLARARGLPGTLIPGPMKLAFFDLLVARWAGSGAHVRAVRAAYRRPDTPNQPILCRGVVTRLAREDERGVVDLELWIENAYGERTVTGAATVELPLRDGG